MVGHVAVASVRLAFRRVVFAPQIQNGESCPILMPVMCPSFMHPSYSILAPSLKGLPSLL